MNCNCTSEIDNCLLHKFNFPGSLKGLLNALKILIFSWEGTWCQFVRLTQRTYSFGLYFQMGRTGLSNFAYNLSWSNNLANVPWLIFGVNEFLFQIFELEVQKYLFYAFWCISSIKPFPGYLPTISNYFQRDLEKHMHSGVLPFSLIKA